jgi:hypothetical protein
MWGALISSCALITSLIAQSLSSDLPVAEAVFTGHLVGRTPGS